MQPINKDDIELEKQPESPKFGSQTQVKGAGKYGQSQHQFIKKAADKPEQEMVQVTLEELAAHKTKESAWISLKGIVYDVTYYRVHHSGFYEILTGCGQEGDNLFSKL